MRFALVPILLAVAMTMTACPSSGLASAAAQSNAGLEAKGLPFRWSVQSTSDGGETMVMHMLPLPVASDTKADPQLKADILKGIQAKEQTKGRPTAKLKEVRQMQDGREVWVLQSLGAGLAYVVSFGSQPGVTKIGVLGPYTFSQ